jgi:biotin operon repressor
MQTPSINDGDYLPSDSETFLLKLLRMFRPGEDKLAFGNSYWRTCRGVLELEGERFSLDDLEKTVNQDSTFGKEKVSREEISTVLKMLKENGFLDADAKGFKPVSSEAAAALNEFFGFNAKPGTGKIGFEKYLAKSQKRVMMWYCLHEPHAFITEKSAEITGYSPEKCRELLERFPGKKWLERERARAPEPHKYSVIDRNTIFQELLSEYNANCSATISMGDLINFIVQRYEEVSGAMIRKDLEEEGLKCDRKTVYNHMKTLEDEGILKEKEELIEGRGAHQKLYAVNLGYSGKYSKDLIDSLKNRMRKSSLPVSDKFLKHAEKLKPTELTNFWQSLRWGFVLRSPDQTSTLPLWLKLLEELYPKLLSPMLSDISNVPLGNPDEKLKAISDEYKMSPLITSILYYSLCKFPEKGTDPRKNQ